MFDMNSVISNNILTIMKRDSVKQIDLAKYLGVSKQTVCKMLSGARIISAAELQKISKFLGVSMEYLVKVPDYISETNTVKAFMGKVESVQAKKGLEIADEIADIICFYTRVCENAQEMMKPWEE